MFFGYLLIMIFLFFTLFIVSLIGGSIMSLFGFSYISIWALMLYFLISLIINYPLGIISSSFTKFIYLKGFRKSTTYLLFIILDSLSSYLSLAIADYLYDDVNANYSSMMLLSLLLAFLSINDFKKNLTTINDK